MLPGEHHLYGALGGYAAALYDDRRLHLDLGQEIIHLFLEILLICDEMGLTTVEMKVNYLAPVQKGRLVAKGQCIKIG